MSVEDDLRDEGPPEAEFHAGIAARLPRKRTASGALIRDPHDRILFVIPNYKPGLDIPGGVVEAGESPLVACQRETREELGIEIPVSRLLVVDWVPAHGVWGDGIVFVYDGGTLDDLPDGHNRDTEIDGLVFLSLDDAIPRLRPSQIRRLSAALLAERHGLPQYLEFGRRPLVGAEAIDIQPRG